MTPRTSSPHQDRAAARAIDAIIKTAGDWRSTTLARLRAVILSADASIVEEVKWKKPSRPMGVPVWSREVRAPVGSMAIHNPRSASVTVWAKFGRGAMRRRTKAGMQRTLQPRIRQKVKQRDRRYRSARLERTGLKGLSQYRTAVRAQVEAAIRDQLRP
jgi:hypothetical protein